MKFPTRALFAAVFIAVLGVGLHGQAPAPSSSNATILAKIATLEKEIAVLRAQLQPETATVPVLSGRPSSLAEASAAAAKVQHTWPTSTNAGGAAIAPSTSSVSSSSASTTDVTQEPYWRERRRVIDAKMHDDQAADRAAMELFALMGKTGIARRDPAAYVAAMNDMKQKSAAVSYDVEHLVPDFYAEGKRAGVPETWLRPSDR